MSRLLWTGKNLRRLADELSGHKVNHTVVGKLLETQKFSRQANSKTREGAVNPNRDPHFQAIKTPFAGQSQCVTTSLIY